MSRLSFFCVSFLFLFSSVVCSSVMAPHHVYLTETALRNRISISIKNNPYSFCNNLLYFMTTQHINDAYVARSAYPAALYLYHANSQLYKYSEQDNGLRRALESVDKAISADRGNGLLYFLRSLIEEKQGFHQRSRLSFEEGCRSKRITGYGVELTTGISGFLKGNETYNAYNAMITYAYIEPLSLDASFLVFTSKRAVEVLNNVRVARETRAKLYNNLCDYINAEEGSLVLLRLPLLVIARSVVQKAPPDIATRSCSIDVGPMIRSGKETLAAFESYKITKDMRVLDASPLWRDFSRVERYLSRQ